MFLSGQMTCAMLLGAGLLLRAQAALHNAPAAQSAEEAGTRPAEMMGERLRVGDRPRASPRVVRNEAPAAPRAVHKSSHTRKGFAHQPKRSRVRKTASSLQNEGPGVVRGAGK